MKLKFRKFVLYPIMDKLFNYKTKPSNIKPMNTILSAHPVTTERGIAYDLRTITFEDWILMIIRENVKALPKQLQKQYENKK